MKNQLSCLSLAIALVLPAGAQVEVIHESTSGEASFSPFLISADGGSVAGQLQQPSGGTRVGYWTIDSGLRELDSTLPQRFYGTDMSHDGRFIAGRRCFDAPSGGPCIACLWDTTTDTRIDLGTFPGTRSTRALAVSDDGSTIAGDSYEFFWEPDGLFHWTSAGGFQSIPIPVGSIGTIDGMSSDGSVVAGKYVTAQSEIRAFTWTELGGLQLIPGLENTNAAIFGMSADGQVVFGSSTNGRFYYRAGLGFEALPAILTSGTVGEHYLSADGSTVTGRLIVGNAIEAFVWRVGSPPVLLGSLTNPTAISSDGRVVTGGRRFPTGPAYPFRWDEAGLVILDVLEPRSSIHAPLASGDGTTITVNRPGIFFPSDVLLWRKDESIGSMFCGPAALNSQGLSGKTQLSGTNVIGRADLALRAYDLPPSAFTMFFLSRSPGSISPVPGSQGFLCLDGPFGRLQGPGQIQPAGPNGVVDLVLDASTLPAPIGSTMAGDRLFFQAWYRDSNPTPTSNFTSAATVELR